MKSAIFFVAILSVVLLAFALLPGNLPGVFTPIANNPTFWFAGSYSASTGLWATSIAKNGYTSNRQP